MSGAGVRADIRGTDVCTFCGTALLACDCVVYVCLCISLSYIFYGVSLVGVSHGPINRTFYL